MNLYALPGLFLLESARLAAKVKYVSLRHHKHLSCIPKLNAYAIVQTMMDCPYPSGRPDSTGEVSSTATMLSVLETESTLTMVTEASVCAALSAKGMLLSGLDE